jgi:hypothetical protein
MAVALQMLPFSGLHAQWWNPDCLQVAIEPALPHQLPELEAGLQLLNRADAFVTVTLSEDTGEWLLGAAGEIHLETCLKDLQERFARIELRVSPPLVSFKESVVHPAEVPVDSPAGTRHRCAFSRVHFDTRSFLWSIVRARGSVNNRLVPTIVLPAEVPANSPADAHCSETWPLASTSNVCLPFSNGTLRRAR